MNILITGGCGFLGSMLAKELLKNGHRIVVVDITIHDEIENVDYYCVDLSNPTEEEMDMLCVILNLTDLVFHFASSVGVEYIDKNPKKSLKNSLSINNIMFPLFDEYNVKVVYSSSSEVYGNTREAKETDILKIGSPDKLRWGYACSKLMSEFMLKSYDFPYVIVRFFNVTGEGHLSETGMVIPRFISHAIKNEDIIVFGDGYQYRTFCDIRDAIEMLKVVGFDDVHNGEIYNIGNPLNCVTINDLSQLVVNITGSESTIKHLSYSDCFSDEFGEIYERKPNTDKIKKYYKCKYSLPEIVRSMI